MSIRRRPTGIATGQLLGQDRQADGGPGPGRRQGSSDGTWSGPCWKPIGKNYGNAFSGTFLGGGHKISNLYFEKSLSKLTQNIGLFANIGTGGYVEGINLVSGYLHNENANTYLAGIAGINAGTIVSCHNGADVYGESYIAGIAANASGVIVKCSNSGTIGFAGTASRGSTYGGIAAMAKNIIANCYNTGTISVAALEGKAINAGGIVGIMQKNYTVRTSDILFNCYSSGNIVRSASATSSGPIYGAYKKPYAAQQLLPEDGRHQQRLFRRRWLRGDGRGPAEGGCRDPWRGLLRRYGQCQRRLPPAELGSHREDGPVRAGGHLHRLG